MAHLWLRCRNGPVAVNADLLRFRSEARVFIGQLGPPRRVPAFVTGRGLLGLVDKRAAVLSVGLSHGLNDMGRGLGGVV